MRIINYCCCDATFKTNAADLTGGAEQLFGKQKARGFEAFLIRVTVVLGTIFMLLAFALAYISSK